MHRSRERLRRGVGRRRRVPPLTSPYSLVPPSALCKSRTAVGESRRGEQVDGLRMGERGRAKGDAWPTCRGPVAGSCFVVALCLCNSCGARTGLEAPRVVPLRRAAPVIVFLVDWDANCDNAAGTCFADELYDGGRDHYEAVRYALGNIVPMLDDVALIGAMPSQTLRLGVDGPESAAPGWPASDSPGWCWTPGELSVPIGRSHGRVVEHYFSRVSWPVGERPNGQGALLPNLPVVERALFEASTERSRRLLILVDDGERGCGDQLDAGGRIDEARYVGIRDHYARLAERGVRTLVVGLTAPFSAYAVHSEHELQILNAEAEGGGLPRVPEDESNPVLWYDYQDERAIQEVLEREIVTPYWCTLFTPEPVHEDARVELISTSANAEAPEYDPTRSRGWDFLDPDGTTLGLFGAACEAARDGREFALILERDG